MCESDQAVTVAIYPCGTCGAGLIEACRFCRSCGARQTQPVAASSIPALSTDETDRGRPQVYETTRLSQDKLYHPVSGPLVRAVAAGVPANASQSQMGNVTRRMLLALMAIPIWVMIILLSPLDAYTSAKIIGTRI